MDQKGIYIRISGAKVVIDGKKIFDGLDWNIRHEETWAILGPNGSGKSILIAVLMKQIPISDGKIVYCFRGNNSERREYLEKNDIGLISPETQHGMTGDGYYQARWHSFEGSMMPAVSEYLSAKSIEHVSPFEVTPFRIDESVYIKRREEAIKMLDIDNLMDRKLFQLSSGESRKVLMARIWMQKPELIILDDPYRGLDDSSGNKMKNIIENMIRNGNPKIILALTDYNELPEGITHILELHEKRIIFKGEKKFSPSEKGYPKALTETNILTNEEMPRGEMEIIRTKNIQIRYQNVKALDGIDWIVKEGECWALFGNNGAGKSTLLSLITGDHPQAYANDIHLFGKKRGSGESIWEIKNKIGYLSPEMHNYFMSEHTCLEAVCSGFYDTIGLYRDCPEGLFGQSKLWMERLGIKNLQGKSFREVSGGEQRLTLLARALVKNPELLILDEPCQGIDCHFRRNILKIIDDFCRNHKTTLIYVTHNRKEIPSAVSYVLELEKGKTIYCGKINNN